MTADRIRNAVILVVLGVWVVVVGFYLYRNQLPDAPLLGIPGAVWLALHPPRIGRGAAEPPADGPSQPQPEGGTAS